jgi:hypothetical protein
VSQQQQLMSQGLCLVLILRAACCHGSFGLSPSSAACSSSLYVAVVVCVCVIVSAHAHSVTAAHQQLPAASSLLSFILGYCSTTYEPAQKFPQLIFLKELSFRTSDAKHAARVVQEIKVLRSTVLQRDKERAERATLVKQEKLVRGKVRDSQR